MELLLPCTGVCKETIIEVVPAAHHDEAVAEVAKTPSRIQVLKRLVTRLAMETPSVAEAERTYRALQLEARQVLRGPTADRAQLGDDDPVQRLMGWLCTECGRFEAPQPCLGICIRRSLGVVDSTEYDEVVKQLEKGRGLLEPLSALVHRLAWATPRESRWQKSHRALQAQARTLLATLPDNDAAKRISETGGP
jgi:hypothetical protein